MTIRGAATDLEKAVTMGAKNYETFANLGNAKFRLENYKDAITNYDKAIAAGSADAILYNNRGKAKFNLQDFKGSLTDFDKAIELKAGYDKAIENRALRWVLRKTPRWVLRRLRLRTLHLRC